MTVGLQQSVPLATGLPGGEAGGAEADVGPLTGADEAYLLETAADADLPSWSTAVLSRAVERIGDRDSVDESVVRSLTVGDRQALLLHLRRLTFGDAMDAVLDCGGCGEPMDLELAVRDLLVESGPARERGPHETTFSDNGAEYRVEFRLPTGADLERAAREPGLAVEEASDVLLRRCVQAVFPVGEGDVEALSPEEWPASTAEAVGAAVEERDPQGELRLDVACPACGERFTSLLDAADYLRSELEGQLRRLYDEVHALAYHYRWSESEIMGLPSPRRRRYVEALSSALSER